MEIIGLVVVWTSIAALAIELKARNERIRSYLRHPAKRDSNGASA